MINVKKDTFNVNAVQAAYVVANRILTNKVTATIEIIKYIANPVSEIMI